MKSNILMILILTSIMVAISLFSFQSRRNISILTDLALELNELENSIQDSNDRFNDVEANLDNIRQRIDGLALEQSDFDTRFNSYRDSTSSSLSILRSRTVSRVQFESILEERFSELEGLSHTEQENPDLELVAWDAEGSRDGALQLLENNPNNISALKTLGRIAYEEGDLYSAESYYLKVIDFDTADEESFQILSRITYRSGRYPESITYYKRLVSLNRNPNSLTGLGRCFYMTKDYGKAYEQAMDALSLNSDYHPALELKKDVSLALGRNDEAEEALLQILERNRSFDNLISLGNFYRETGQEELSLEVYEEAYKANPLETLSQQEIQVELLRTMMAVAYGHGSDSRMDSYYRDAELLGGDEEIHILMLRRLKELNQTRKVLKSIELFEANYPASSYIEEVKTIKDWAKGV